jgi:sialate O-acetylesterase
MDRTPGTDDYRNRLKSHLRATENWLAAASAALQAGAEVEPNPVYPSQLVPFKSHQDPTMLHNGMISPLVGFPMRGVIWYQGESNHAEGMLYTEKKRALIKGWRRLWGQGDFPFYYVQIAPFQYGNEDPSILAKFWEAQAAVQQIPNTAMVVINDIATLNNIHPPNKQDVGQRLALLALKNDYGRDDVVAKSPEMESFELLGKQLRITFRHTGGGLKSRDAKPISHFEVIGEGSYGYKPANATIQGDSLVLASDDVERPVAFRFAWNKMAEPNLMGGTGLPVGAFRGGEEPDFVSTLAIESEYELVYDIDLTNLSKTPQYDVDNSSKTPEFDRIGYLLELGNSSGPEQKVFVSMKAFTDAPEMIGIPTVSSGAVFQKPIEEMDVYSNVDSVAIGSGITSGNIEFWSHNYGPKNVGKVASASDAAYDFGDERSNPVNGYGSMQIHNHGERQTVFAINNFGAKDKADLGIGNSSGANPDWTFSGNAASYATKRLRVYVRVK